MQACGMLYPFLPTVLCRARLAKRIVITQGLVDLEHDQSVGFELISTDDIDDFGIPEIIQRIRNRVGDSPVYLSFDIDVIGAYALDPQHIGQFIEPTRKLCRPWSRSSK